MIFKFYINGTVRAENLEEGVEKLKKEFGEEFFNKYISFGNVKEDMGQEVDIK